MLTRCAERGTAAINRSRARVELRMSNSFLTVSDFPYVLFGGAHFRAGDAKRKHHLVAGALAFATPDLLMRRPSAGDGGEQDGCGDRAHGGPAGAPLPHSLHHALRESRRRRLAAQCALQI